MLTINTYSGQYQSALRPVAKAPRLHSLVKMHENPDARERDDFQRILDGAGLNLDFERSMPRAKMDIYRVVKA